MNILLQTDIPETLHPAMSTRTIVFLIIAIAALTSIALDALVWWWRWLRERAREAQDDRSEGRSTRVPLEVDIESKIGPIRARLEGLEKLITVYVPHQEKQDLADTKLQAIQEELSKIPPALGQISDLLREVLVNFLGGEDRRNTDERVDERIDSAGTPTERATTSLDALLDQHDISQVLALVISITHELKRLSENWEKFEKDFSPYLQVAQRVEKLRNRMADFENSQQKPPENTHSEMQAELEVLRTDLESLARNQRAIWFIDLIEEASRYPSIHNATASLKQALGLEETQIAVGTELRDTEDVDVVGTDGMGRNAVISEVVGKGYREKETGALLRKPKVKVTLEG